VNIAQVSAIDVGISRRRGYPKAGNVLPSAAYSHLPRMDAAGRIYRNFTILV
jgi:hypothetical protein